MSLYDREWIEAPFEVRVLRHSHMSNSANDERLLEAIKFLMDERDKLTRRVEALERGV